MLIQCVQLYQLQCIIYSDESKVKQCSCFPPSAPEACSFTPGAGVPAGGALPAGVFLPRGGATAHLQLAAGRSSARRDPGSLREAIRRVLLLPHHLRLKGGLRRQLHLHSLQPGRIRLIHRQAHRAR